MIGPLCDVDSQQLMPGGVAILFAWGHPSTNILKKGSSGESWMIKLSSAPFFVVLCIVSIKVVAAKVGACPERLSFVVF